MLSAPSALYRGLLNRQKCLLPATVPVEHMAPSYMCHLALIRYEFVTACRLVG